METCHYRHLLQRLAACEPRFRWRDGAFPSFADWHDRWRDTLLELLAPWPGPVAASPRWETLEERSHYTLRRVTYATEPGLHAHALVAIPRASPAPVPGVLAIHGHGTCGVAPLFAWGDDPRVVQQVTHYEYDYGHRLAERGVVVWAPALRGFGDRLSDRERTVQQAGGDPCNWNYMMQSLLGETAITSQLHDLRVALALLSALPEVDDSRLACAGLSYGGRLAMFLTAIEPALQAAIVSGALNSYVERAESYACCGYQVVPGLLKCGDIPELMGLIAPRPLALELADRDPTCPVESALEQHARVGAVYLAAGAPEKLKLCRFQGGHVFRGTESIPWLLEQLHHA